MMYSVLLRGVLVIMSLLVVDQLLAVHDVVLRGVISPEIFEFTFVVINVLWTGVHQFVARRCIDVYLGSFGEKACPIGPRRYR
jgi:hypothetical protein